MYIVNIILCVCLFGEREGEKNGKRMRGKVVGREISLLERERE